MILGIDPGLTGALALITDEGSILNIYDMPMVQKAYGKGNMISPVGLADIVDEISKEYKDHMQKPLRVFIEQVSAMPGQGVSSMFSFGRSLGVVEGVIASYRIPIMYITPRKWKTYYNLTKKDKDVARTLVLQMYPNNSEYFRRKKDIGRADSLLIALYGAKHG